LRGKGTIDVPTGKLMKTIIEAAIAGFEAQKKNIDAEIAELRAMLTGGSETIAEEASAKPKRRKFSCRRHTANERSPTSAVGQDQGRGKRCDGENARQGGQTERWPHGCWPEGAQYRDEEALGREEGGQPAICACGSKEGGSQNGGVTRHQFH